MKRAPKLVAAALGASMLLAGCGDAPEQQAAAQNDDFGNEIELVEGYDPDAHFNWAGVSFASSWDPIKSINGGDGNFYEPVYDRLLYEGIDGELTPMLATEYTPAEDGKSLSMTLQEGLTFSDGTPFNAEAVKFNLDRARGSESKINGELYQVTSVDVVDEYTVELQLSGSIGSLPVALANRAGMMVSPTAAQAGQLDSQPIGIGPYIATSIEPGNKVEFELAPNYWDPDAQRVATMTYYYMPDDQTRMNALKTGELDGTSVPATELDNLAQDGYTPIVQPSSLLLYFALNTEYEPFGDPEVRKAINMSINREEISQGLYDGYCSPQIQPFPKSSPGYSEKIGDGLDIFPYDPEEAKKILEEAGVTAPIEVATAAPNVTIYTKFAEVLQAQLSEVGINVEIHAIPPSEMVQEFSIDKVTETFTTISTGINDPDVINSRYIASTSLFNPGNADYPKLTEYGNEGASSADPEVRKPAYEKYMDAWVETPPHVIPVCLVELNSIYADNISGVTQRANGYPSLRGVAVAKE